jgi:predicted MPP superfamily phosphohydrolase
MGTSRVLFFIYLFSALAFIQSFAFWSFRKFGNSNPYFPFIKDKKVRQKFWKVITIVPFVIFNIPYIYLVTNRMDFSSTPRWFYNLFIIPFFIFQAAIIFLGLLMLVLKIIKLWIMMIYFLTNRFRFFKERYSMIKAKREFKKFDDSRRKFIRAGGILLTGYTFTKATVGVINKDEYAVTEKDIEVVNLPSELQGLRILLISDVHSGPYMLESQMKEYVDVINSYNADLILIPGDLTNSQRDEVYPFAKAFRNLKAKYGVYATLGNHDYFHDAEYVAKAVSNETPIKLMRNENKIIDINNKQIILMGMDDTRTSSANYDPVIYKYFDKTIAGAKENAKANNLSFEAVPKILLYHKPYFFNDFSKEKIDLTVSGHTHGGQIVFAKFGSLNLSIASFVSNFLEGLYKNGNSNMYVTRGIGTVGLPLRLNCRPEITILTLKQKSPAEN